MLYSISALLFPHTGPLDVSYKVTKTILNAKDVWENVETVSF